MGDERELIHEACAGDEAAFAALVDRYAKPILNFCARIVGDATEAEDLAQETFVRAWQNLRKYRAGTATFSTWLFQIARNASLDRLRSRARKPAASLDSLVSEPSAQQAAPDEEARRNELGSAIAAAVADLPEEQRTAFVLAEYHGQSMREIAAVMDCSEKSVEGRLSRARLFLREKLAGWGKPEF